MHSEWQGELKEVHSAFDEIDTVLVGEHITPDYAKIMRALALPISSVRVVIFGQDPYPKPGYADGLAFSVGDEKLRLPATLQNIFKELATDCPGSTPKSGDLQRWSEQGVLLLNRILTTRVGESLAHVNFGWKVITDEIAQILGENSILAILWGRNAQELSKYFSNELTIKSAHPSPLSAYRGFFGSKPFSRANEILSKQGIEKISW